MSWRWFRPNFQLESFLRSIIQESHINHRSELSGDNFHEWAMTLSKFFIVESFLRSIIQESHIIHRSELSGDHFHEWAMFSFKFSCREFLEIYSTKEPHQSQKWAIWRPFSWVGNDFVQIFMSRVFFRSIGQKSHINHRSELSGDLFHEWALVSSKFSCREFLEIYNTREPNHSQKWAIWRQFSWVGDDFVPVFYCREFLEIYNTREPHHSQKCPIWRPFSWVGDVFVQIFMSRVSWHLYYKRGTSFTEVSYLETIFTSGRRFCPNFHVESFLRSIIQESHINHKVTYLETIFMSGRWFCRNFRVQSFSRSIIQESHINHRRDLSGDHFHEWAMILKMVSR